MSDSEYVTGVYNASESAITKPFVTGPGVIGATELVTLGESFNATIAYSVDDLGLVAGTSYDAQGRPHAVMWGYTGSITDLGGPGSEARGFAGAKIVGFATNTDGRNVAFMAIGSTIYSLGTLGGTGSSSLALAGSGNGQIVGTATSSAFSPSHAFITDPFGQNMRDIGTLVPNGGSVATAVNFSGQVAGYASTAGVPHHAFKTGPDGVGMIDLGALQPGWYSEAYSINDQGQVVGVSFLAAVRHAFLFDGGVMLDLNSLEIPGLPAGTVLVDARAITRSGEILVNASNNRTYILSPVSEPSTCATLMAGGLLLAAYRRRLSRRAA
jgi:probable HAF family extracellular repeat protein